MKLHDCFKRNLTCIFICFITQEEIQELKEQLTLYESASQFGAIPGASTVNDPTRMDDSYSQLGIKQTSTVTGDTVDGGEVPDSARYGSPSACIIDIYNKVVQITVWSRCWQISFKDVLSFNEHNRYYSDLIMKGCTLGSVTTLEYLHTLLKTNL